MFNNGVMMMVMATTVGMVAMMIMMVMVAMVMTMVMVMVAMVMTVVMVMAVVSREIGCTIPVRLGECTQPFRCSNVRRVQVERLCARVVLGCAVRGGGCAGKFLLCHRKYADFLLCSIGQAW